MKTLHIIFLVCAGIAAQAQNNFKYLDINHVKAGITSHGSLHYNPATNNPSYEVPIGSGTHANAFTNLWFGGMYNNQLHLAAQIMPHSGLDFIPLQDDRVWKLNRTDIDAFISNYANGNVQNGTFVPAADLLDWPGNGNLQLGNDPILAPFVDVNHDLVYDPVHSGDYPLIKGDQALYFIYKDVTPAPHISGGATMELEIRGMAYAYGTCSVVAANPVLDYTTFYDYTVINRSSKIYTDFYMSLHTEADLGNYNDDYIGCNVPGNYGYIYNGDSDDQTAGGSAGYGINPPASAFVMLNPVFDGIDNDNDGMTDEPGEDPAMTGFSFFNNATGSHPSTQAPSSASDYYNYMKSLWKDGTPLTCNGTNGYGGTTATLFAFPGTTYTNSPCGASNWSETSSPGDRRYMMNTRLQQFYPGQVAHLQFAHITSFPGSGNALIKLNQDVQSMKTFYHSGAITGCITGMKEHDENSGFRLYPNPATNQLNLAIETNSSATIEVIDIYGKTLSTMKHENGESISIDISTLASGIYFVKVSTEGKSGVRKFVKG